ncbi:M13 family metallopeptidase [Inhella gelatinilytica]|uniref:M13 family metallopeptidase n=1 Tax=Inhella gelatinilytica TaxID=2795030 RepID=A0A931J2A1_9BURK|nr:M13 family metallopeptidase [Inhella gelatinilytica]MBH9554168.1 M13 family metallopeptidase [Inhella gelatinilytica]
MTTPALRPLLAALALAAPYAQAQDRPLACTDFYAHVNGAWMAQTELPPERSRIGAFDGLRVRNEELLQKALNQLEPTQASTPGLRHAATLWRSGMDTAAIERQGLAALKPLLDALSSLQRREQLPALLAQMARHQVSGPFAVGVRPDVMNTTRHTLSIGQSGLTLPDRDDYTRADATAQGLRSAARDYRATLLKAADGAAPSTERLDALEQFEARLAAASSARVDLRNPRANYHPHLAASLQAQAPGLDWAAWIQALGLPERAPARFVVGQPDYLKAVAREAAEAPLPLWRDYLRLRVLDAFAAAGPKALQDAHFAYYDQTQRGLLQPAPRHERVVELIGGRYGGAPLAMTLGEAFVQVAFPAEAARRSAALVEDIKAALRERIFALPWMAPATKLRALDKLNAMSPKIGAPAQWPTWVGLQTRADDFLGNLVRGAQWQWAQRAQDLGQPVDRSRWFTSPHIVNAFAGGLNEIVFPAGILQPPFFSASADDAANFGGIGMVIGHEIIHHFDDRGRQFDAVGNLNDWWTAADAAAYQQRADEVVRLYGSFEAAPGEFVNGRLTLGENISDMAGVQIAYAGLLKSLKRTPNAPRADGLTPQQGFFTQTGLIWRSKMRTEALIQQLRTDSHSPPRFRVLAPLAHSPAFAEAFGCRAGDPMVAEPRISIW